MPPTTKANAPTSRFGVPVLVDMIHRGDGTYLLKPVLLPADDGDTWLTTKQATKVIGGMDVRTVRRLIGVFLVYRKPLPTKLEISLRSALALRTACHNPEFWESASLQRAVKEQVRKDMDNLVSGGLQRN